MKSNLLIISLIITFFAIGQNNINKLFFDLPLDSTREVIYQTIKNKGFTELIDNKIAVQNNKLIKVYFGNLNTKSNKRLYHNIDSVQIQLSCGSVKNSLTNKNYNQLILWSYYHFNNKKHAKNFYKLKKANIISAIKILPVHFENTIDNKKNGYTEKWKTYNKQDLNLSITFKNKDDKYIIILKYSRFENYIKPKFKKKLIIKDLKSKTYSFNTVKKIPITKECSHFTINEDLKKCVNKSIFSVIQKKFDTDIAEENNLPLGKHRISSKFIIDTNGEIINIKVKFGNKILENHVKQIINEIPRMKPGMQNGINVNVQYFLPITFTIEN